jgi:release factor glutamine methyltransferase
MTLLLDEIAAATARLAEAGVDSPRADAELIAAHVHGVGRGELQLVSDGDFDPRFWNEVARREAREPLQHITGLAYFRYLELQVGPGVFVPRPETEVMTGWAIDELRDMDVAEPVVADLGTGSAAIALAIAQEVPRARVHAVEADPLARQWAQRNIARSADSAPHTRGRVALDASDFAGALPSLSGAVDLVISNPPYIPVGATARGRRVRPGRRALGRPGRAGRRPGHRGGRAAAAPVRRAGGGGARRAAGRGGLLDIRGGAGLAGHP